MITNYSTIEENMKGKSAFMTGGTSGLGKATVAKFVQAGVDVVFIGLEKEAGENYEKELNALGKGKATFMQCDVRDFDALADCVNKTAQKFGKLDVLFNCAGIFPAQRPADQWSIDEYMDVLNTNLVAYFVTIRTALPHLRKTKGVIINIGSVLGKTGDEGACAYATAKGGIENLTRTIAIDEARHGVRCVEVKPGHMNTEMFFKTADEQSDPEGFMAYSDSLQWMNRGGTPDEIAYVCLFMASDWAGFITGTDLMVSGGYDIGEGPKILNPYLASNKDKDGNRLYPDQEPLMKWVKRL